MQFELISCKFFLSPWIYSIYSLQWAVPADTIREQSCNEGDQISVESCAPGLVSRDQGSKINAERSKIKLSIINRSLSDERVLDVREHLLVGVLLQRSNYKYQRSNYKPARTAAWTCRVRRARAPASAVPPRGSGLAEEKLKIRLQFFLQSKLLRLKVKLLQVCLKKRCILIGGIAIIKLHAITKKRLTVL